LNNHEDNYKKIMKKNIFKNKPIFIPKSLDSKLADLGMQFPAILMDGHNIEWRPGVLKAIRPVADVFIVNPVTHRMLFKDAKEKSSFKKLPYPKNINAEKLYSDPEFRMEKIIKASVEYQIKRGASLVIAPYLFAEDTDDTKFVLNLTMLSETIKYLKDNKINLPLFAMIHIGSRAFTKTIIINSIIDRYREGFEDNIQGFIITVDELDDRKASEESLSGLAYMAFQLSKGHDVLVNSIGGFGEILSVLGCCGFISGLGTGETTSVKILQDTPRKIKGRSHEWTYIPEIFDYAHDSEVKKIGYKCSCSACNGAVPVDIPSKMRHFLFRKIEIMSALRNMNSRDRINFMKERIDKAHETVRFYKRKHQSPFKSNHLVVWKNILEEAKHWTYDESDDRLDDLLKDLESKIQ